MKKQVDVKKAYGLIKDARGNARYVREMVSQVEEILCRLDAANDHELCRHIMTAAGVRNAIDFMDGGVLDFMEEAIQELEGRPKERDAEPKEQGPITDPETVASYKFAILSLLSGLDPDIRKGMLAELTDKPFDDADVTIDEPVAAMHGGAA